MRELAITFTSIILEALPFIILGAFVAAFIQVCVSSEIIERLIPENKGLGYLVAAIIGLIFPVCECAIIPIARELIKKGVPVGMAVTFMLAVPIINPITLLSTYSAFGQGSPIVLLRTLVGFGVAIVIGRLMEEEGNSLAILKEETSQKIACGCGCEANFSPCRKGNKIKSILEHTSNEFIHISKYLIFGALVVTAFQKLINPKWIEVISRNPLTSVFFMMGLAFVLSLCSEVDAFIARTFVGQFTSGPILAFLILGPMLDVKNMFMLFGNFKAKFVLKLMVYCILLCCLVGLGGQLLL